MAGDWIKIEKATARKPEVLLLSEILSVHPDHAFGLCVRFWSWCDDQLVDGHAPRVTDVTLDTVFGHAGFVSALISVGWLQVRNGSLEVPHFDRHLSESAKARALSGNRKQRQRTRKVSRFDRDEIVTREEKRRIVIPPKSPTGDFSWESAKRAWISSVANKLSEDRISAALNEAEQWPESDRIAAARLAVANGRARLTRPKRKNNSKPQMDPQTRSEMIRAGVVKEGRKLKLPEDEIERRVLSALTKESRDL